MAPTPVAVLPDELIREILSFLPVNSLLRFRCVCKSWKTLISDPSFVKLHLKKSQTRRNPLFTHFAYRDLRHRRAPRAYDYSVVPYSLHRLIENPPFTLTVDPYYHLRFKECVRIAGTCNGLIILVGYSKGTEYFRLWNPTTRTISPNFGHLGGSYKFSFGCDDSTDTYKIVASRPRNVRILSLGHNVWRDIQSGPVAPLHLQNDAHAAVYLCSTVNWLAINNDNGCDFESVTDTVDQFVISSLDLGTETFNQYRLPTAFDEMPPHVPPIVSVLGGFLCFSYFYKKTDFVIWQMKEFRVEDSWTQFLKISLQNLQRDHNHFSDSEYSDDESEYSDDETRDHFQLVPVLLSEDADTLVLTSSQESHAILYNWRDDRVERSKITTSCTVTRDRTCDSIKWYLTKVYIESLVSTF